MPARGAAVTTLVSAPETQFNAPRWSPDGARLAVERHRPGAKSEIVVVDVATRAVQVVASNRDTRFVTPAWRPDGRRRDRGGRLRRTARSTCSRSRFPAEPGARLRPITAHHGRRDLARRLERTDGRSSTSATTPTASICSSMPYPARGATGLSTDLRPSTRTPAAPAPRRSAGDLTTPSRSYSPWRTAGADVVVAARRRRPSSVAARRGGGRRRRARLPRVRAVGDVARDQPGRRRDARRGARPTGSCSTNTRAGVRPSGPRHRRRRRSSPDRRSRAACASTETRRERQLEAGVLFPVRARPRRPDGARLGPARRRRLLPAGRHRLDPTARRCARAGRSARRTPTATRSARKTASPLGVTAEFVRRALGASGDATTLTGDVRAYLPGLAPHHVVALRVVGRLVDRRARRPPHVSPRRRRGASAASSTSGATPSACCADFRCNTFAGSHVGAAERRLPLAARAAAARRRHVAAVPPHGARRRCSRTPATRGRARSARGDIKTSVGRRALLRRRRRLLRCRSRRRSARRGDTTAAGAAHGGANVLRAGSDRALLVDRCDLIVRA